MHNRTRVARNDIVSRRSAQEHRPYEAEQRRPSLAAHGPAVAEEHAAAEAHESEVTPRKRLPALLRSEHELEAELAALEEAAPKPVATSLLDRELPVPLHERLGLSYISATLTGSCLLALSGMQFAVAKHFAIAQQARGAALIFLLGATFIAFSAVMLFKTRHPHRIALRMANLGGFGLSVYSILGTSHSIAAIEPQGLFIGMTLFIALNALMFILGASVALPFSLLFEQPKEKERKSNIQILGCGKHG